MRLDSSQQLDFTVRPRAYEVARGTWWDEHDLHHDVLPAHLGSEDGLPTTLDQRGERADAKGGCRDALRSAQFARPTLLNRGRKPCPCKLDSGTKTTAESVETCWGRFMHRCWRRLNVVEFHHGVRDAVRLQRRVCWPRTVSAELELQDGAEQPLGQIPGLS